MTARLPQKILVVDNDQAVLQHISHGLEAFRIEVITAREWESAFYQYNHHRVDLCLIALDLQDLPGTALVQKWRNHEISSKRFAAFVLALGLQRTPGDAALIKELGDVELISKPIQIPLLLNIMAGALQVARARETLLTLEQSQLAPLLKKQKYDAAVDLARTKLEPIGERGCLLSAEVHLQADKFEHATKLLEALVHHDPKNMRYHNTLAKLYMKQGNFSKARESFDRADKEAPGNLERMQEMAQLYLKLKEPEASVQKFSEILKLTPENKELRFTMYEQLAAAGYLAQAQDFCKQTSTPMELLRHYNNKGVLYSKNAQYDLALKEYETALQLLPGAKEQYRIFYNIALAYFHLKTPENLLKSQDYLHKSLQLQPDYSKAKELLEASLRVGHQAQPSEHPSDKQTPEPCDADV